MGDYNMKSKLYDNVTSILVSAVVLFAALAWRDCAVIYINNHPQVKSYGAWTYAAIVTAIAIFTIVLLLYPLKYVVTGLN